MLYTTRGRLWCSMHCRSSSCPQKIKINCPLVPQRASKSLLASCILQTILKITTFGQPGEYWLCKIWSWPHSLIEKKIKKKTAGNTKNSFKKIPVPLCWGPNRKRHLRGWLLRPGCEVVRFCGGLRVEVQVRHVLWVMACSADNVTNARCDPISYHRSSDTNMNGIHRWYIFFGEVDNFPIKIPNIFSFI